MLQEFKAYINDEEMYNRNFGEVAGNGRTIMLAEGIWNERRFVILRNNIGTPVAYIETFPEDIGNNVPDEWLKDEYGSIQRYDLFDVFVNGGATYYGEAYWERDPSQHNKFLGWDYAHCGDFTPGIFGMYPSETGHKWTLLEIFADVVQAEQDIIKMNERSLDEFKVE